MIVLIGPKHSGKTSVGRELALLLELPFYDLDRLIEEQAGQSVRALYNAGPELFRQAEEAALEAILRAAGDGRKTFEKRFTQRRRGAEIAEKEGGILAAGGGITDNPGALALLTGGNTQHITVYLDVPAQTAWQRIINAGELPPFLGAETTEASMEKHRLLHERRSNDCRKIARFSVTAGEKTPVELAAEIRGMILAAGSQ